MENVVFLGKRKDVPEIISVADILVAPSLLEGFGLVIAEAMAAGKPVICLDAGGPGTHVTEECGIKITASSPEEAVHQLAGALERLHQKETLRLELGRAARERALQVYHWDRLGERLMEIYQRAVNPANLD